MAPTVSYDRLDESYTFGELNSISNLIKLDSEPPQGSDPNQKFTIPSDAFDHSERCVKILEELDDLMNLSQSQKQGQVTRGVVLDGYHLSPTEVVANARWVFNFFLFFRDQVTVLMSLFITSKQTNNGNPLDMASSLLLALIKLWSTVSLNQSRFSIQS